MSARSRFRMLTAAVPLVAVAAAGALAAVESDRQADIARVQDAFAAPDAATLSLAQRTAYLGTVRTQAPRYGAAPDARLLHIAERVCASLEEGRDADGLAPPAVVVRAAHAAYCPDLPLSTVVLEGDLS